MKRHRYKTFSYDVDSCQEGFGGPARCALPRLAEVHYSDTHHPFTARGGSEEGPCGWRNQGASGLCNREVMAPEHAVVRVRPPDEDLDRNEPATAGSLLRDLARDAQTLVQEFSRVGAVQEDAPAWERAVGALRSREPVTAGPWSVRLYDLSAPGAWRPYMDLLGALGRLHVAYTASVWWVRDRRMAYVTWGDFDGMTPDWCADEILRTWRAAGGGARFP